MLPPKNWGGRKRRYEEYRQGVRRSVDPFSQSYEQIRSPLEDEHWTVQRFRPDVESIRIYPPSGFLLEVGRRRIRAKPSLLLTLKDGTQELHLVLRYAQHERRIAGCESLARHLRARLVLVSKHDVRRDVQLLKGLDYLQRCAARQLDDPRRPDEAVLSFVQRMRQTNVGEIRQAHASFDKEAVDGAIAVAHIQGKLKINFCKEAYGARTVIHAL